MSDCFAFGLVSRATQSRFKVGTLFKFNCPLMGSVWLCWYGTNISLALQVGPGGVSGNVCSWDGWPWMRSEFLREGYNFIYFRWIVAKRCLFVALKSCFANRTHWKTWLVSEGKSKNIKFKIKVNSSERIQYFLVSRGQNMLTHKYVNSNQWNDYWTV